MKLSYLQDEELLVRKSAVSALTAVNDKSKEFIFFN